MQRLIFFLFVIAAFCATPEIYAQGLFDKEVLNIQKRYDSLWDSTKNTIVFTGSSSIRMWKDVQERFPEQQIVNSGFGGSEATDLDEYLQELVLNFNPSKVFIYEGDNDINAGKSSKEILRVTEAILNRILEHNPKTEIVLISAKPSIARWQLKRKYKKFNRRLAKLSERNNLTYFADVWSPMVENKKIKKDLFIEDDLHMNAKGYELWYDVIKNYIK